jgi:hypothetical protein
MLINKFYPLRNMKEKIIYSKIYDYKEYQVNYPKILKYIKDNFIEGPIIGSLLNFKQDYTTLNKDVLIKVTQDINETKDDNNYKSTITVEKVGPNAKKLSEIENILIKDGFKTKPQKKH